MKTPSLEGMVEIIKSKVTREALHKRFTKEAVTFLKHVLVSLQQTCIEQKIKLECLKMFSKVLICDSTWFKLRGKLKNIFPGFGGNSPEAHCKLQLVYEYLSGQIDALRVTGGAENDHKYLEELLSRLSKGVLLLIDLGYFSVKFFSKIHNKGAYFVTKLRSGTRIFNPKTSKEIDLLKLLKKANSSSFEINVLLGIHKELSIPCKLIGVRVPKEVAEKRRRTFKKKASHCRQRKITLELYNWTLIITNIQEDLLPPKKICELYRLRWQIEIVFKQFKSILQIHKINTTNEHRVLCEIYGKLIAAIVITKLHGSLNSKLWNTVKRELSLEKFFKRVQERMFIFVHLVLHEHKKGWDYLKRSIRKCLNSCIRLVQRSRISSLQMLETNPVRQFRRIFSCKLAA